MKIKIITFVCMLVIFLNSILGCGIDHTDVNTDSTTTAYPIATHPIPPRFYDMESLESAIKNKDEAIAERTKDITEIYRPEVKLEGYALGTVEVYKGTLTYYFVPSEFAGEKWLNSDEADDCVVTVYYTGGTDLKKLSVNFVGGVEWLDDEIFYYKSDRLLYFKFEDKICSLALPKTYDGEIDVSEVIEMKTVAIG